MTHLKQQISLIPFSIEHWYSPYKRRRFENRSDQTFCILLIKYALSVSLHSVTRPIAYSVFYPGTFGGGGFPPPPNFEFPPQELEARSVTIRECNTCKLTEKLKTRKVTVIIYSLICCEASGLTARALI